MPKQPAFPGLKHAMKKKQTRRELFLAQMEVVVPWGRLLVLIAPHYPKTGPKGGRPPMPLEVMLRVYFLQHWYALSDPMAEETLYDSDAMRRFAGGCHELCVWPLAHAGFCHGHALKRSANMISN